MADANPADDAQAASLAQLGKYVRDPEGLCNTYHQAAVGAPPGKGHA